LDEEVAGSNSGADDDDEDDAVANVRFETSAML
jgi:hypothetical protein